MATLTLEQLLAKLPDALKPLGQQYGPAILKMAQADIQAWLSYVFVGKYMEAYTLFLKASGADALLTEWDTVHAEWEKANAANADRIAASKLIAEKICLALLTIVLAAAGF